MLIKNKEQVAEELIKTMWNIGMATFEGFFRRTMMNMKEFYFKVD